MNESMVAMLGWIMPDPFAHPPMTISRPSICAETATSFGCVSVVIIERAKRFPPSSLRMMLPRFCLTRAMGSSTPMSPVLPIRTCSGSTSTWAAARAVISSASVRPCCPTEQLAHPLFATIARALPLAVRRLLSVTEGREHLVLAEYTGGRRGRVGQDDAKIEDAVTRRLDSGMYAAGREPLGRCHAAAMDQLYHRAHPGNPNSMCSAASRPARKSIAGSSLDTLGGERGYATVQDGERVHGFSQ